MDLRLNYDDMTIGDLEDFEDAVGMPLDQVVKPVPVMEYDPESGTERRVFDDKGRPESTVRIPAKALRALVWIIGRKDDPSFTFEAARNVKVASMTIDTGSTDGQGND